MAKLFNTDIHAIHTSLYGKRIQADSGGKFGLTAQWKRDTEIQMKGGRRKKSSGGDAQHRLELIVEVAKSTQTLAPVCSCQEPQASTSRLQAFSDWELL